MPLLPRRPRAAPMGDPRACASGRRGAGLRVAGEGPGVVCEPGLENGPCEGGTSRVCATEEWVPSACCRSGTPAIAPVVKSWAQQALASPSELMMEKGLRPCSTRMARRWCF